MRENSLPLPQESGLKKELGKALESAAYPTAVRCLSVVIVLALAGFALWSAPSLREVQWSFATLSTYGLAGVLLAWVGWWMVFSRTRYADDELVQTWLWDKRVHAREVATFKIVHWPWLQFIVSPRMLVRKRNGGMTWMHSADVRLLVAFGESVVRQGMQPSASSKA